MPRTDSTQLFADVAHFDRLAGSARLRKQIEAGATLAEIMSGWRDFEAQFSMRAAPALLYT